MELDPRASDDEFGVRLMPNEVDNLEARARNAEAVVPVIEAYGRDHADVYGGSYIDQLRGGRVVAMFISDLAVHETALWNLLHPAANWTLREVEFAQAELEALHQRIDEDRAWFASLNLLVGSLSTDLATNRVELVYNSAHSSDSDLIRGRFDVGPMLSVVYNPDPVAFLPRGALRGQVVDAAGRPVADLLIQAIGEIGGAEPDGGIAYGTDSRGEFSIPRLAAMEWEVQALLGVPDAGWKVVGTSHVVVRAGAEAFVLIEIP